MYIRHPARGSWNTFYNTREKSRLSCTFARKSSRTINAVMLSARSHTLLSSSSDLYGNKDPSAALFDVRIWIHYALRSLHADNRGVINLILYLSPADDRVIADLIKGPVIDSIASTQSERTIINANSSKLQFIFICAYMVTKNYWHKHVQQTSLTFLFPVK